MGKWGRPGQGYVNEQKKDHPLPFFNKEEDASLPSEEKVFRHLAQTLSVTKTLKRFPSLKAKDLQEIFLRGADRAQEEKKPAHQ